MLVPVQGILAIAVIGGVLIERTAAARRTVA
jgi:hypothetical protein